jgi:hypothetical protein
MMRWLGRWIFRVLAALAVLMLAAIAVDWCVYVLRGSPQSSVAVSQLMSVPLKGQKTEYDYVGTADVACDVALFPHGGEEPCWYLKRHATQWENLGTPQY